MKPLDTDLLSKLSAGCRLIVTIEEHSILGGLGGSVAECLAERPGPRARMVRCGTADEFLHETGEQEHARDPYGLKAHAIAGRVRRELSQCK